jgi:hypothetical protein
MKIAHWIPGCIAALCLMTAGLGREGVRAEEGAKEPSKLELSGAEHRLDNFEFQVKRAKGQPIPLSHDAREALERIAKLKQAFPNHPKVLELFERARKALLQSKGETTEIPPDMLRYRENEVKLRKMFAERGEQEWTAWSDAKHKTARFLEKPFPPPDHAEVDYEEVIGHYVVLEDFFYPSNEFRDLGRQFVFVGSGTRGYYFVQLSNRAWLGAYEAVRRYKRLICHDVPEGGRWTIVGRITGLEMLVPEAGEEKTRSAAWGWNVVPEAIYVPDRTFAVADGELELGGAFAGEADMEALKSGLYTVTSIPEDATPERLAEIYAIAIKEKNYPLYLDCIDPDRRKTPTALSRIAYHWDLHQQRFANLYCHVVVGEAQVTVLRGFSNADEDLESVFLTDEERKKIQEHSEPLLEHAELKTQAFDERGRQYGSRKPRFFRRLERGRWYITNYDQPF